MFMEVTKPSNIVNAEKAIYVHERLEMTVRKKSIGHGCVSEKKTFRIDKNTRNVYEYQQDKNSSYLE